jgi:hypothetical protein
MLSGDTRVRGEFGWKSLSEEYGNLHAPTKTGRRYTFGLAKGSHSKKTWDIIASRPHLWPLVSGEVTYDLREGDVVPANKSDCGYSPEGWLHGYLKREGYSGGVYTLYKQFYRWTGRLHQLSIDKSVGSDKTEYRFPDFTYQQWPYELGKTYEGAKYVGSFIQGFMDAGTSFAQVAFNTSEAAWWFYGMCPFAGYIASGVVHETRVKTQATRTKVGAAEFHTVYKFYCAKGSDHAGFRVLQIDPVEGQGLYVERGEFPQPACLEGGIQALF